MSPAANASYTCHAPHRSVVPVYRPMCLSPDALSEMQSDTDVTGEIVRRKRRQVQTVCRRFRWPASQSSARRPSPATWAEVQPAHEPIRDRDVRAAPRSPGPFVAVLALFGCRLRLSPPSTTTATSQPRVGEICGLLAGSRTLMGRTVLCPALHRRRKTRSRGRPFNVPIEALHGLANAAAEAAAVSCTLGVSTQNQATKKS
ncbi:hypothetical protein OBBRIDRAFT_350711 [Obba rivulosa]|uniref:Uncharacterized protein n=1 Tax=Obba rivulosa TaxID=1052685 RepID=A0A8E2DP58_9APHY|nr:hypothetical protein OBBRIDRAFT_350711 [Obba rivulosa]